MSTIVKHNNQNNIADGYDHYYYEVTQDGSVLRENHRHSALGSIGHWVNHDDYHVYKYDHSGRLFAEVLGHDGSGRTLYFISFDELGRPKYNGFNGNNAVISQYTYDIHGNLREHDNNFFKQQIYYDKRPDGTTGLLGGRISAMDWQDDTGLKRRYTYSYDRYDRLVDATYSEPDGRTAGGGVQAVVNTPDYSCRYSYDLNGNMTSLRRRGVTSHIRDGRDYKLEFGTVYSSGYMYDGNQRTLDTSLKYEGPFEPLSTMSLLPPFGPGISLELPMRRYDANGNMIADPTRDIEHIGYDRNNRVIGISFTSPEGTDNPVRLSYMYDADGNRLSSSVAGTGGIRRTKLYCGRYEYEVTMGMPHMVEETFYQNNGFMRDGFIYYYVKDYLGNVRSVVGEDGSVCQRNHYYPYGGLMDESNGEELQPYMYGGKEYENNMSLAQYDYGARIYTSTAPMFGNPDPHAIRTPHLSPYAFCDGDPLNYSDPTGCEIRGVTKKDAAMAVEDFRAMFPGDTFSNFRNLITRTGKKQNGKSFAPISQESLSAAFSGITLNEDQQALVEMVVNTINSDDVHMVEYLTPGQEMSRISLNVYSKVLNSMGITSEMASNIDGGYSKFVMALCGEASTTPTTNGSISLILKTPEVYKTNRPATVGHEVIGHGRYYRLGYIDAQSQHIFPIQVENLILRNMGTSLFRDGSDHAPLRTVIPNYMNIPKLR